jgi:hypothetical protein
MKQGFKRFWRQSFSSYRTLLTILFLFLLFALARSAEAHETRMVGPYRLVVGFAVEPAYEGQMNGVQLRVSEGEGEDATPVEGLQETVEVEVTHVPSGTSQTMPLRAVFGDPGHYRNDWIPSAPGDYRFRFTGTIGDMEIDETFESGPDTFNPVQAADAVYFPEPVPAARELEGAVRGAQGAADEALSLALDAEEEIGAARTLGMIALGLSVVAAIVAVVALVSARRS